MPRFVDTTFFVGVTREGVQRDVFIDSVVKSDAIKNDVSFRVRICREGTWSDEHLGNVNKGDRFALWKNDKRLGVFVALEDAVFDEHGIPSVKSQPIKE